MQAYTLRPRTPGTARLRALRAGAHASRAVFASLALLLVHGCSPDGGGVRQALCAAWLRENSAADGGVRELAKANGWKMYVRGDGTGIGRLELGDFTYEPLYSAAGGRTVGMASKACAGRIAFVECTERMRLLRATLERSDFELGILRPHGDVTKMPLDDRVEYRWPRTIAMFGKYAFLASFNTAYLLDVEAKNLDVVFKASPDGGYDLPVKAALVPRRFLLVLVAGQRGAQRMIVLTPNPPYRELRRIEGVSNIVVVGGHVVFEKANAAFGSDPLVGEYIASDMGGTCFLYLPDTGGAQRLAAGNLLCNSGTDAFLFCMLEKGNTSEGRGQLCRYTISSRSWEPLWRTPERDTGFAMRPFEEKFYDYNRTFLSADNRFLFIPWHVPPRSHAELHLGHVLEYEVYDLESGEKRGAFLNLDKDQGFLQFLGWEEAE